MSPQRTPRLVLTAGEPAGVGPELCAQVAGSPHPAQIVVACCPDVLEARARALGLDLRLAPFDPAQPPRPQRPGRLEVLAVHCPAPVVPGRLDPANARHVLGLLEQAVDGCLAGVFDAMVTAPVHKGVINDAGIPFSGHTEFLAARSGGALPVMMLTAPGLRVALATTHLPLRSVADAITPGGLESTVRILHEELVRRFALPRPRILVCGLNPHAGEGGHLGREEIEVIIPTLERLRGEGMDLTGPLPADTLFTPRHLEQADAVLAMYHDQGLPVLKHIGFGNAVNVTLGLPLIRTSVDHGTALDLAGTGRADPGSLEAALALATQMATADTH